MTVKLSELRFELKFVCGRDDLDRVMTAVRGSRQAFRRAYPSRVVRNAYFDTPDLDCYYQNLAGISQRDKVRLRWYGDLLWPADGVLEFKRKRGLLGWKESQGVTGLGDLGGQPWRESVRRIDRQLKPWARVAFGPFTQAVLINSYQRRYFVSADGTVRLTVDTDLKAWNQIRSARPNVEGEDMFPDVAVIELKAGRDDEDVLHAAIQDMPLRGSRFSKFCVALQNFLQAGRSVHTVGRWV